MGYDIPPDHHSSRPGSAECESSENSHAHLPPEAVETILAEQQQRLTTKDTNPKDAVGTMKWRQYCTVPTTIVWELGVAMLEGARKYGRHNYRVAGVRASVYVDAAKGHIDQYWEGEDNDPDSPGLSHITKAMASLAVLRDAMINDMVNDDRPPRANIDRVRTEMQEAVEGIFERYPDPLEPYTQKAIDDAERFDQPF